MGTGLELPSPEDAALGRLRVAGRDLAVRRFRGAQPGAARLVGIHGLGSSGRDLAGVAQASGLAALLIDLPGFGRSEGPHPTSLGATARLVTLALDANGWAGPVAWLGCSYGGHVALRAALDAPERVASLTLVSSGGLAPVTDAGLVRRFDERALGGRSLDAVAAAIDSLYVHDTPAVAAYRASRIADHAWGADYAAVAAAVRGALDDDTADRLEDVTAPVELVHGAGDALVPLALARRAAQRLPGAVLTALDDTGHLPWLERPAAVAARIRCAVSRTLLREEEHACRS